jgi:hydroxymethylglutaryl-CoA lyase
MELPKRVKIVEVGARDGLQNEARPLEVQVRIDLVDRLAQSGFTVVEVGSFVSPKWVPQMAGTDAVLAGIHPRPGVSYPVLVPNMRGFRDAVAAGAGEVAVFAAATETFSRRNLNCSIAESMARFREVCAAARNAGIPVRGYVSCVLGCPYEGDVSPEAVASVATSLWAMGCYEISLGDTIGVGTAGAAQTMVDAVARHVPREHLAVHFHDTYGQALANIFAVMERGIATIDSAVAGLGGCPFAKVATGNIASEDVVYMLNGLGIATGIDLPAVVACGRFICDQLGRAPVSKAHLAMARRG